VEFRSIVESGGGNATGIVVPDEVVESLGSGKRPAVVITVGDHSYRTTVARMGGRYLVPLAAEHRNAAGVAAGDEIDVGIALDAAPRTVEVPADLAAALDEVDGARAAFDALAFTHRKEWVRSVEDAKRPETRARRIAKAVEAVSTGAGRRS
jgi:antitoxin component of MazEF toxin-antitoxin module